LTGSHLPDEKGDFSYALGIILDGKLYSATRIMSTIRDRGEITGSFTHEQVDDLVRVLNAGSLPVKIRPVKK
jgi:SecD/SecF fusion protein